MITSSDHARHASLAHSPYAMHPLPAVKPHSRRRGAKGGSASANGSVREGADPDLASENRLLKQRCNQLDSQARIMASRARAAVEELERVERKYEELWSLSLHPATSSSHIKSEAILSTHLKRLLRQRSHEIDALRAERDALKRDTRAVRVRSLEEELGRCLREIVDIKHAPAAAVGAGEDGVAEERGNHEVYAHEHRTRGMGHATEAHRTHRDRTKQSSPTLHRPHARPRSSPSAHTARSTSPHARSTSPHARSTSSNSHSTSPTSPTHSHDSRPATTLDAERLARLEQTVRRLVQERRDVVAYPPYPVHSAASPPSPHPPPLTHTSSKSHLTLSHPIAYPGTPPRPVSYKQSYPSASSSTSRLATSPPTTSTAAAAYPVTALAAHSASVETEDAAWTAAQSLYAAFLVEHGTPASTALPHAIPGSTPRAPTEAPPTLPRSSSGSTRITRPAGSRDRLATPTAATQPIRPAPTDSVDVETAWDGIVSAIYEAYLMRSTPTTAPRAVPTTSTRQQAPAPAHDPSTPLTGFGLVDVRDKHRRPRGAAHMQAPAKGNGKRVDKVGEDEAARTLQTAWRGWKVRRGRESGAKTGARGRGAGLTVDVPKERAPSDPFLLSSSPYVVYLAHPPPSPNSPAVVSSSPVSPSGFPVHKVGSSLMVAERGRVGAPSSQPAPSGGLMQLDMSIDFADLDRAASTVQAAWRGHKVRKDVKDGKVGAKSSERLIPLYGVYLARPPTAPTSSENRNEKLARSASSAVVAAREMKVAADVNVATKGQERRDVDRSEEEGKGRVVGGSHLAREGRRVKEEEEDGVHERSWSSFTSPLFAQYLTRSNNNSDTDTNISPSPAPATSQAPPSRHIRTPSAASLILEHRSRNVSGTSIADNSSGGGLRSLTGKNASSTVVGSHDKPAAPMGETASAASIGEGGKGAATKAGKLAIRGTTSAGGAVGTRAPSPLRESAAVEVSEDDLAAERDAGLAATKVQAAFRGYRARKMVRSRDRDRGALQGDAGNGRVVRGDDDDEPQLKGKARAMIFDEDDDGSEIAEEDWLGATMTDDEDEDVVGNMVGHGKVTAETSAAAATVACAASVATTPSSDDPWSLPTDIYASYLAHPPERAPPPARRNGSTSSIGSVGSMVAKKFGFFGA
ncbi:hypothetical protein M427DRAFT_27923 [Gonapodya prolifera JEL478]|uniref:Uncharacterized protein n=1 Tax=Gonapodya prolifera (strain JEL478) TaxID=1344416 RepID=A0A139AVS3_GONPJ|nr:hypothetical protein M427DRAFT_27923 [Gonapodya prolifera JEL478]|eukprot:KXS20838.1 hypothetical protein M427DRAFT_27923 [Gonapodya prolifera JEL478]